MNVRNARAPKKEVKRASAVVAVAAVVVAVVVALRLPCIEFLPPSKWKQERQLSPRRSRSRGGNP